MNLVDRPLRVFSNQRLGIGCDLPKRRQIVPPSDVTQRDANIAQKTTPLDSFDR